MTASGPTQAIEARRAAARTKEIAVDKAVRLLGRTGAPIERTAIARLAGVSRSFTYENAHARAVVDAAQNRSRNEAHHQISARSTQQDASWRERALNAEDRLVTVKRDLLQQRQLVGDALAQLRDPDGTWLTEERGLLRHENEALLAERNQLIANQNHLQRQLDAARTNATHLKRRLAEREV